MIEESSKMGEGAFIYYLGNYSILGTGGVTIIIFELVLAVVYFSEDVSVLYSSDSCAR